MAQNSGQRVYIYCDKTQSFHPQHAHLIGSYAALGRNNVQTKMRVIEEHLHLKGWLRKVGEKRDEDVHTALLIKELNTPLNTNVNPQAYSSGVPERKLIIMDQLQRALPWSKVFLPKENTENPLKEYYCGLSKFLKFLDDCRHYGMHAAHPEPGQPGKTFVQTLETLNDQARTAIKDRFNLENNRVHTTDILSHLVLKTNKGLDKKCRYQMRCVHNKEIEEKFLISRAGLIFFIALWLDKSQAVNWLKQHTGYKGIDPNTISQKIKKEEGLNPSRATIELFCYHCIRSPKPKLEPQFTKTQGVLDMMGELHRCPENLYNRLSNTDKIKFVPARAVLDDDENEEADEGQGVVKMIRSRNRFPYFAVRYLDENRILEDYRFHINLGKYVYQKKEKHYKESLQTRYLEQLVLRFGHPQDYKIPEKSKRAQVYQILQDQEKSAAATTAPNQDDLTIPYWIYAINHYHFSGHQIGIKKIPPEAARDFHINEKKGKIQSNQPEAYLPNQILASLVFYDMLLKRLDVKNVRLTTKMIIEDFLNSFNRLVKLIDQDGFRTHLNDTPQPRIDQVNSWLRSKDLHHWYGIIPHQLQSYFIGKSSVHQAGLAEKMLKTEIEKTEAWLEKIRNSEAYIRQIKNSKQRERKRKSIRYLNEGHNATALIRDILKFVPEAAEAKGAAYNNKPNRIQHDIMQKEIAYFSISRDSLIRSFNEFGLINSNYPHPFLRESWIRDSTHNLNFCKNYLNQKITYLKKCLREKDYSNYYFLRRAFKPKGHPNFIDQIRKNGFSIGIPKAYVTLRIKELLALCKDHPALRDWPHLSQCISDIEHNSNNLGGSRMIKSLNHHLFLQDAQPFYSYKRSYALTNALENKNAQRGKKYYFDQDEFHQRLENLTNRGEYKNQIDKARKEDGLLREYLLEDGVLMLMAKAELERLNPTAYDAIHRDLSLQNIDASADHLLSLELKDAIKIYENGHFSFSIRAQVNLKNAGIFYGYRRNRLVQSLAHALSSLYPEDKTTMPLEDLNRELKTFESLRITGIKTIREFENKVFADNGENFGSEQERIDHSHYLKLMLSQGKISEEEKKTMNKLRNGFSHNEYKKFPKTELSVLSEEDKEKVKKGGMTALLKNILDRTYGRLVDQEESSAPRV